MKIPFPQRGVVCRKRGAGVERKGINVGSCGWGWIVIPGDYSLFSKLKFSSLRLGRDSSRCLSCHATDSKWFLNNLAEVTNCRWSRYNKIMIDFNIADMQRDVIEKLFLPCHLHLIHGNKLLSSDWNWKFPLFFFVYSSVFFIVECGMKKLIGIMIYSLHNILLVCACTFQDVYCKRKGEDMRFWQISCCYKALN